mgnify:CR=1 FL=1
MSLLEIKKFGCPTLKEEASEIGAVDEDVQTLIDRMFATMYCHGMATFAEANVSDKA